MEITIRREEPSDHRAVEELTREAFWGLFTPRCDEHLLVHLLRESPSFVPELDVVAEADAVLVGHVIYSRASVTNQAGMHEVLTFGPLSVLPSHQFEGVGGALMRRTLPAAAALGHRAVVVYGHADYYPRFGFRPAARFGITAPGGGTFDSLMALALVDGGLDGITGEFHEDPVFDLDPAQAAEFDRGFPPRPDAVLTPLAAAATVLPSQTIAALRQRGVVNLADLRRYSRAEMAALPRMDDEACGALRTLLADHGIRWGR